MNASLSGDVARTYLLSQKMHWHRRDTGRAGRHQKSFVGSVDLFFSRHPTKNDGRWQQPEDTCATVRLRFLVETPDTNLMQLSSHNYRWNANSSFYFHSCGHSVLVFKNALFAGSNKWCGCVALSDEHHCSRSLDEATLARTAAFP